MEEKYCNLSCLLSCVVFSSNQGEQKLIENNNNRTVIYNSPFRYAQWRFVQVSAVAIGAFISFGVFVNYNATYTGLFSMSCIIIYPT